MEKLAPWTKWAIAGLFGLFVLALLGSLYDQATQDSPQTQQYRKMADDNDKAFQDIQRAANLSSCLNEKRTDCDQYRK
jgi:hypothetical protein